MRVLQGKVLLEQLFLVIWLGVPLVNEGVQHGLNQFIFVYLSNIQLVLSKCISILEDFSSEV